MKVRLRELKPNPVRDFVVDPLDEAIIDRLRGSIREHGFWGGVVGRQRNGHIEIGAGHHRVEAAILEGVEEGEVHVLGDIDDRMMTRLYAEENATQRGSAHSTARAGSVAAALRLAAYEVLTGMFSGNPENIPDLQGNIANAKGIGAPLIHQHYLKGVPGITVNTVQQDLASLKKSGEYARIIADVRDRIIAKRKCAEREAEEARRAAEEAISEEAEETALAEAQDWEKEAQEARASESRAEKAAEKAAEQEPTFDFKGVAAHLKVAHHLESFREVVTREEVLACLPVDQQAVVAERVVKLAEETGGELTGLFIRSNVVGVVMQMREQLKRWEAQEKERLLEADWEKRFTDLQSHYLGALRNVIHYGERLLVHRENSPKELTRAVSSSFESTVRKAKKMIEDVEEGL